MLTVVGEGQPRVDAVELQAGVGGAETLAELAALDSDFCAGVEFQICEQFSQGVPAVYVGDFNGGGLGEVEGPELGDVVSGGGGHYQRRRCARALSLKTAVRASGKVT